MIKIFIFALLINILRYSLFSISIFLLVNKLNPEWIQKLLITNKTINNKQFIDEIKDSSISIVVYSVVMTITYYLFQTGNSNLELNPTHYNLLEIVFTVTILMIVHDTYFYWTHRLLHFGLLNKHIHRTHHLSNQTTALTSLRFHPIEAFIEALIIPISIYIIPVNIYDLSLFYFLVYLFNAYGHSGVEIHRVGFPKNNALKWFSTSVHHYQHHKYPPYNFGLYFTFWDRIMGTLHPKYCKDFRQ